MKLPFEVSIRDFLEQNLQIIDSGCWLGQYIQISLLNIYKNEPKICQKFGTFSVFSHAKKHHK